MGQQYIRTHLKRLMPVPGSFIALANKSSADSYWPASNKRSPWAMAVRESSGSGSRGPGALASVLTSPSWSAAALECEPRRGWEWRGGWDRVGDRQWHRTEYEKPGVSFVRIMMRWCCRGVKSWCEHAFPVMVLCILASTGCPINYCCWVLYWFTVAQCKARIAWHMNTRRRSKSNLSLCGLSWAADLNWPGS